MTIPQYFKPSEVADMLKISKTAMYDLLKAGKIAHYKVGEKGGSTLIKAEDLQAYLDSCRHEVKAPRRIRRAA